ncbi:RCC1 domain-containing protein [Corallococcus sp. CA054B]
MAAGGGHSLALFTDGTVRAWGTTPGACLETEGPTPRPGRCGWWG